MPGLVPCGDTLATWRQRDEDARAEARVPARRANLPAFLRFAHPPEDRPISRPAGVPTDIETVKR